MRGHDEMLGGSQRITLDSDNANQVQVGAPIRAQINGNWIRGRFEYDQNQGMAQPMINAGDKKFTIPEGTEIQLV